MQKTQSFAEIVSQRQAAFNQQREVERDAEQMRATRSQSNVKCKFNEMERCFQRQAVAVDKADKEPRPEHARRNTASCLSSTERQARILCVLKYLSDLYGKTKVFPSQDKILTLINRWYGLAMSRRTLNRDLNSMEVLGLFKRRRRLSWSKFSSTMYLITKTGVKWWSAFQKAFGFFNKNRVPNMAHNNVDLRSKGHIQGLTPLEAGAKGSAFGAVPFITPRMMTA
ncbi:MAG: hypothetical protein R8K20_06995 [Gallionellaceae bacterium]